MDIQEIFRELRAADERTSPPFDRTWAAAVSRARSSRRAMRWLQVATACALIVMLAVVLPRMIRGGPERVALVSSPGSPAAGGVARGTSSELIWTGPTDALLRPLNERLLRTVPRVGESVVRENLYGGMP